MPEHGAPSTRSKEVCSSCQLLYLTCRSASNTSEQVLTNHDVENMLLERNQIKKTEEKNKPKQNKKKKRQQKKIRLPPGAHLPLRFHARTFRSFGAVLAPRCAQRHDPGDPLFAQRRSATRLVVFGTEKRRRLRLRQFSTASECSIARVKV